MTGRVLRKTVVSIIAAGIFTRRFFRMEPEGETMWSCENFCILQGSKS